MKSVIPFAVGIFVLSGLSAQAGWQYAKWGMTPAQVEAASKHAAVPVSRDPDKGETIKLTAPYSTSTFRFAVEFGFDPNDKLTSVNLNPARGKPPELVGALRGKYGKPVNETPDPALSAWI